ncbi:regucalcin [Ascoidea rubescens DSM 1968]|uniref:SGL-domain-containing protein n=1 Tax=Ascoidea rubescens DSM 1968 TaxID=1344418 RepID=A0A1D2VCF2_9ASCO|nr:SGL-domain-containing protein [Ascoidea rubescens DSM 1968]ODV59220.1 SGL-domain-containing protein [Ascoidea rubescens DSM 1968]
MEFKPASKLQKAVRKYVTYPLFLAKLGVNLVIDRLAVYLLELLKKDQVLKQNKGFLYLKKIDQQLFPSLFFHFKDQALGESINYNPANNSLIWVDGFTGEIHRLFLPANSSEVDEFTQDQLDQIAQSHEHFNVEERIGSVALTADNDILMACCNHSMGIINFKDKSYKNVIPLLTKEEAKYLRMNDGIVDPNGNFWVGTIDIDWGIPSIANSNNFLFFINAKTLKATKVFDNITMSNGMAFSKDLTKFFHTDTLIFKIFKYDYDQATNKISNKSLFIDISKYYPGKLVAPDGIWISEDDELFVAIWGSNEVARFNKFGKLIKTYHNDQTANVSCPILGGKNGNELYITTVVPHLDFVNDPEPNPYDGALYRIKLEDSVKGQKKFIWGGPVDPNEYPNQSY